MIKINLLADRKVAKVKAPAALKLEASSLAQTLMLAGLLVAAVLASGAWWWALSNERQEWIVRHQEADRELERLEEVRAKGEQFKKQKELLNRKITLITDLKKRQAVPVRILDQVSRSLPDFIWLEQMGADNNKLTITGRATNYNAVSNFYSNLTQSGYFTDVALGRTYEVPEGVAFSLTARFAAPGDGAPSPARQG